MDPIILLPVLAVLFGVMTAWQFWRYRKLTPAARAWGLIALTFGLVSLWLRRGA